MQSNLPASVRETARLPDFRNLGVLLRLLVGVNALALATVLLQAPHWPAFHEAWLEMVGRLEWPLLGCALSLAGVQPLLVRLRFAWGAALVLALAAAFAALTWWLLHGAVGVWRPVCWALGAGALMLAYFDYRARVLSSAMAEARLLALTARIRPHFFFNALNGVLGMIRTEPRAAEQALEHLAVLFRRLMGDHREMRQVRDELQLCRDYLEVETLRLGERLRVRWEVDEHLLGAQMPPFLLQPLLENAVYHGIEPAESGEVVIRGRKLDERTLEFEITNPAPSGVPVRPGNHMAQENIRERLALFFDLEATLEARQVADTYRVRLRMPLRMTENGEENHGRH